MVMAALYNVRRFCQPFAEGVDWCSIGADILEHDLLIVASMAQGKFKHWIFVSAQVVKFLRLMRLMRMPLGP